LTAVAGLSPSLPRKIKFKRRWYEIAPSRDPADSGRIALIGQSNHEIRQVASSAKHDHAVL
jgi:hypothetical protein